MTAQLANWLVLLCEFAAYALGAAFVLFLLFMAWMVLEDLIEKDGPE